MSKNKNQLFTNTKARSFYNRYMSSSQCLACPPTRLSKNCSKLPRNLRSKSKRCRSITWPNFIPSTQKKVYTNAYKFKCTSSCLSTLCKYMPSTCKNITRTRKCTTNCRQYKRNRQSKPLWSKCVIITKCTILTAQGVWKYEGKLSKNSSSINTWYKHMCRPYINGVPSRWPRENSIKL